jgi:succinate dehydrogenase / fumarate reductase, cytochrome b subunit
MNILCQYTASTVGKKTIVAITGLLMVGFLFTHMLGNLQMFDGRGETIELTKMNAYAAFLKKEMALLWVARIGLILTAVAHVAFTIQLTRLNRAARPQSYGQRRTYSSAASRMMIYGGLFILGYIVYHLMHFTLGNIHPDLFHGEDVYQTVVDSFQIPMISIVYILAMMALFGHLYHGTVSLFQTLGVANPVHLQLIKKLGIGLSVVICGGFISIPLSVWLGWIS